MTFTDILLMLVVVQLLIILHETGHVIAAKTLGLTVQKVGFSMKPYPHFFVSVVWPQNNRQKSIYLFAGFATYILLFSIALSLKFFSTPFVYYAFFVQAAIELNPFYSDFTIARVTSDLGYIKKNRHRPMGQVYKEMHQQYLFTARWYIHFVIWVGVLLLFSKIRFLVDA